MSTERIPIWALNQGIPQRRNTNHGTAWNSLQTAIYGRDISINSNSSCFKTGYLSEEGWIMLQPVFETFEADDWYRGTLFYTSC
jgi:hypothetical protein